MVGHDESKRNWTFRSATTLDTRAHLHFSEEVRVRMRDRIKNYYLLKATLVSAELLAPTKLVLTFEKWNDPAYSAKTIDGLRGFVVVSIKKPKSLIDEQTELFS